MTHGLLTRTVEPRKDKPPVMMLLQPLVDSWRYIATTYRPMEIEVIGTLIVQLAAFYGPCLIYMSLPIVAPEFSERHKLQKAEKQPTANQIKDAFLVVLRNQAIGSTIQLSLALLVHRSGNPLKFDLSPEPPRWLNFLGDIFIALIVREALFYYTHRLFHHRRLYPYIHKTHHRFTAPCALAAQYAHPLEHVISNVLPIVIPCVMLRTHVITFWVFLTLMLFETSTVHSGYDFWPNLAEKHDRHHEAFIWNFGACVDWFDRLHGTKEYKDNKAPPEVPKKKN